MKYRISMHAVIGTAALAAVLFCTTALAGNIDPDNDSSRWAWGENIGWLSFVPLFGPGVTVTDTELTGFVWAENIGWINLSCENRGTCDDVDYRVTNDGSGILGGFAWGEKVGWISFSCENRDTCADVDYGASIGPGGYFSGYGWGENIGWINFDLLTQPGFPVLTSWEEYTPNEEGGGGTGGGGTTGPSNKKPVIDEVVTEQQEGYTVLFSVEAHDPDGEIVRYSWRFSENLSVSTPRASVSHSFDGPGTYAVTLTVKDNNGTEMSDIFTFEVTKSVNDNTPPAPEEEPDCDADADCGDGEFCNGEEKCVEGGCVAGEAPCTPDEVCIEDEQTCWTEASIAAKSLVSSFRRPRVLPQRCIWRVLDAEGAKLFNPDDCRISYTGPGGTEHGIAFHGRREVKMFAGYILVPLCITKDAQPGEWILWLQTEAGSTRETIEFKFTIE